MFLFAIHPYSDATYTPPSETPASSTTPTTPTIPNDNNVDIIFGDKAAEKVAAQKVEVKDNIKTTTITLDDAAVKENLDKLDEADQDAEKKIIIPVSNKSDVVIGVFSGQTVKDMEDKDVVLEIRTEDVSYTIPAAEINIDAVPAQLGTNVGLKDIKVSISVADSSKDTVKIVEDSSKKNGYQIVINPVEFEITCSAGGQTAAVSKFNSYVERTVAIPDGIDPSQITTGVVVNKDGTFSHVPTTIVVINGKYYAKINSLTNSTYTVIRNPVTFKDVENHWAKSYVNEVDSRLIDSGINDENFAPDRAITRAEFASIVVKALGLKGTNFPDKFSDIENNNP